MKIRLTDEERALRASESRKKWYRANKERRKITNAIWSKNNQEKALLRYRKYKEKHKEELRQKRLSASVEQREKRRAACKRWRVKFPDRHKAAVSRWAKTHPEIILMHGTNRRAAIKNQRHPEHDRSIELSMVRQASALTKNTGIKHQIDHIIPLHAGGWHHHLNLQILPISVNASKNDNPFWQRDGYKCWMDVPAFLWPESLKHQYNCIMLFEQWEKAA